MKTYCRAVVGIMLITSKREEPLVEGDLVGNLSYRNEYGVVSFVSGKIRAIVADVNYNRSIPDDCPPEPYVQNYVIPSKIIIDVSTQYDADFVSVDIDSIIGVETINGETDQEVVVDGVFNAVPGIVEESNNNYSYTTEKGSILDLELFDNLAKLDGLVDLTVNVGESTCTYAPGQNIEVLKSQIDQHVPKTNDDPPVVFTITVNIANA